MSDLFLTSHAYLKDAAICIRACSRASRIPSQRTGSSISLRTAKNAIQSAMRQARLGPKDLQMVEAHHDSASHVRQALSDTPDGPSHEQMGPPEILMGATGLASLCALGELSLRNHIVLTSLIRHTVWRLRGWTHKSDSEALPQVQNCLQFTSNQDGSANVIILCRSDGRAAPVWSDIENLRDGRERLGYNPAVEVRGVDREDLEAVRARREIASKGALKQLQLPVKGGDRAALARL